MKSVLGQAMNLGTLKRVTGVAVAAGIAAGLAASLAACSTNYPRRDTSTLSGINDQLKAAAAPSPEPVAVPAAVSGSLLPPIVGTLPKVSRKQLEPRFDLSVKDTPIDQVLSGIVADTRYSILIKPRSAVPTAAAGAAPASAPEFDNDKVTLNLRDVTVFEALDALRDVYGYDYTREGRRIYVQPPELETRMYHLNYIIGQRRGVSDLKVIGGASVGASSSSGSSSSGSSSTSGSGSGSGSGSSNYSSVQASGLSTYSNSDLWAEVEAAVRTTLGCQIPTSLATSSASASPSSSSSSSSSSSVAGSSRADVTFAGDAGSGERKHGVDGCSNGRAMAVSPMSGTLLVRGMPSEHQMIREMLKSMQVTLERQVIIEAKIMDVELNAESQQGINWNQMHNGLNQFAVGANSGNLNTGTPAVAPGVVTGPLGSLLSSGVVGATTGIGAATAAGLNLAIQFPDFSALVKFLQTQGHVHVLSSPRISTLNNQKAVIKVGTEESYVTSITGGTASSVSGGVVVPGTSPNLNFQPFFAGISLDVTPQIDEQNNISLQVHSLVNSITEKSKIAFADPTASKIPFAINTISETDTVVKSKDGQVVVIGGLMTDSSQDTRSKVPGLGSVPLAGALFSNGAQDHTKRELVILLKTTVVKDDSAWSDDIRAAQGRVEHYLDESAAQ